MVHRQLSTEDHLQDPGFWPTQSSTSRNDYTGPQACRECHAEKFATQLTTAMRPNAMAANQSGALRTHPKLTFDVGPYLASDAEHSLYTVTNGKQSLTSPLRWVFGTPRVGRLIFSSVQTANFTRLASPTLPG